MKSWLLDQTGRAAEGMRSGYSPAESVSGETPGTQLGQRHLTDVSCGVDDQQNLIGIRHSPRVVKSFMSRLVVARSLTELG
jgi:hypothetical protein